MGEQPHAKQAYKGFSASLLRRITLHVHSAHSAIIHNLDSFFWEQKTSSMPALKRFCADTAIRFKNAIHQT
ncbi:MAG: hypothetical protein EAZ92_10875 [Candidatus Kapaibacterium sp.]|nr:MAG: hypothetical protein EAZ92_10875 [Candidatus Kapabacteria bacterium]